MLKIGWSKKEISTKDPIVIAGQMFMRVSQGILDPCYLTALVVDGGEDYVIFLQSDTVVISEGVLDDVRAKLKEKNSNIDPMKIFMYCSHTHAGPGLGKGNNIGQWENIKEISNEGYEITSPGEYWDFYIDMACEAICEAFETRSEGYVSYGYGFASIGQSRRVVYSKGPEQTDEVNPSNMYDGYARMYGNTDDDTFSHYEAGTDSFANFMFTFDKNQKLTGAIINIPCPSQNSETEWHLSSDYWHNVREEIKRRYGDIFILPQCAAAGDLSPRQLHYKKAEERRYMLKFGEHEEYSHLEAPIEMYRRMDIALRICDAFDEVYSWASKEKYDDLSVVHSVKNIRLDKRLISDAAYEQCKKQVELLQCESFVYTGDKKEDFKVNTALLSRINYYKDIVKKYEDQQKDAKVNMELHVVKLGNIAFASNQFELYMDYQHRIQARSPFEQTFIVQLCAQPQGVRPGGYLATERGVWGNGYSASMFCGTVSPSGGQQLVDETVEELKKIY